MLRQSKRQSGSGFNGPKRNQFQGTNPSESFSVNDNEVNNFTGKNSKERRRKSAVTDIVCSVPQMFKKLKKRRHGDTLPVVALGIVLLLVFSGFLLLCIDKGNTESGSRGGVLAYILSGNRDSVPLRQLAFTHSSPRVVEFFSPKNVSTIPRGNGWLNATHRIMRTVDYERPVLPSSKDYAHNRKYDFPTSKECVPLQEWQTALYPSCNTMHEINTQPNDDNFVFINCGSSRCTFLIKGSDGSKSVLKIIRYASKYSDYTYDLARIDALSMERLTKSHYIVNIYGMCGSSQITEYSEGGNIHDRIKEARLTKTDPIPSIDKLKIAYQVASAVADMHTFERDGVTSLVHLDVCCHQFVLVDGVYKLGDFHLSSFLTKRRDDGEICLDGPPTMHAKLRSPEEFRAKEQGESIPLPNADVYMMGNVMYYVLTNQWLFEGFSNSDTKKKIMDGERSNIPAHIRESKDRAVQGLLHAIEMCWTHDYIERPTSREVADYIGGLLMEIEGLDQLNIVRVSMPSLPKNHRFTDNDFYSNIWN